MINKEARHHEQARHQKDDEDHMRRLDPQHRRPQKTRPVHSALTLYPPRTRPIICSTWAIGVSGTMPWPRLKIWGRDAKAARMRSRSEEHTSELQSLMRISYAVFCLIKKKHTKI